MTNSQPRAARPSAIRRRPQSVPSASSAPSVDEFIQAGTNGDAATVETATVAEVSSTMAVSPTTPATVAPTMLDITDPSPPYHGGEGKIYVALFLGVCALGASLFSLYHSTWEPLREALQGMVVHVPAVVNSWVLREHPYSEGETLATATSTPSEPPTATATKEIKGAQWLAITNLQFARHDLLLGLNTSARDSLILAKLQMNLLDETFTAETNTLDRIISRFESTTVLSLGELDLEIETLKNDWRQFTFGSAPQRRGLFSWLAHNHQEAGLELETTEEGRYLVARLDRLKWLALWGDENGLRQASANIETFLGAAFLENSATKSWQHWLRKLQRIPLRHDVAELTTLIVRLARMELVP